MNPPPCGIITVTRCSPIFRIIRSAAVFIPADLKDPNTIEGHYLEFLQPDSGYMKTLAEQGAVGLALLLIFYFMLMRYGFYYFFRVKDPEIRNYYIALLIMMFTLIVAQYAQMAITQCPVILFFYAILVIFIKLADFDTSLIPLKQLFKIDCMKYFLIAFSILCEMQFCPAGGSALPDGQQPEFYNGYPGTTRSTGHSEPAI